MTAKRPDWNRWVLVFATLVIVGLVIIVGWSHPSDRNTAATEPNTNSAQDGMRLVDAPEPPQETSE